MRAAILALLGLFMAPSLGWALPQFAVLSSRACDNCHVDPVGWENPDVSERKCSLNCSTCHVNPTGGGARKVSGRYYGQEVLPLLGFRPSERVVATPRGKDQPEGASSRPAAPGPGSEERFAGTDPTPWFYYGGDFRLMYLYQQQAADPHAFFPMQVDLYLGGSPYNPDEYNVGRLTIMTNLSVLGSRGDEFSGFQDRFFLREYYALFHDLPYQMYAKVGQFLPAFGWRLDDHTAFIRQNQSVGQFPGFNNERQVNGIEVGLNPNYLYSSASFYINGPPNARARTDTERFSVLDPDNGFGAAITAGYRELLWQLGGSLLFETRDDANYLMAGANWSLNLHEATHPWKGFNWAPIIYLGEFDVLASIGKEDARSIIGLTAFHEIDVVIIESLFLQLRYDWRDPDIELKDDHFHRFTSGLVFHPVNFVEVLAQLRINIEAGMDRLDNQGLIQLHLWY